MSHVTLPPMAMYMSLAFAAASFPMGRKEKWPEPFSACEKIRIQPSCFSFPSWCGSGRQCKACSFRKERGYFLLLLLFDVGKMPGEEYKLSGEQRGCLSVQLSKIV